MRRFALIAILVGGFALGAGLSTLWRADPDTPEEAFYALFDRVCLPGALGGTPPDLESLGFRPGPVASPENGEWIDPATGAFVTLTQKRCEVMLYPPLVPASMDVAGLNTRVTALVQNSFPELRAEPNPSPDWRHFALWMQGGRQDPDRWGVTLTQWKPSGEDASVRLSIHYPPK